MKRDLCRCLTVLAGVAAAFPGTASAQREDSLSEIKGAVSDCVSLEEDRASGTAAETDAWLGAHGWRYEEDDRYKRGKVEITVYHPEAWEADTAALVFSCRVVAQAPDGSVYDRLAADLPGLISYKPTVRTSQGQSRETDFEGGFGAPYWIVLRQDSLAPQTITVELDDDGSG